MSRTNTSANLGASIILYSRNARARKLYIERVVMGVGGCEARQGEEDGEGDEEGTCGEGGGGGLAASPEAMTRAHCLMTTALPLLCVCALKQVKWCTLLWNECWVLYRRMMAADRVRGLHGKRSQHGGGWPSWWKQIEKLVLGPFVAPF